MRPWLSQCRRPEIPPTETPPADLSKRLGTKVAAWGGAGGSGVAGGSRGAGESLAAVFASAPSFSGSHVLPFHSHRPSALIKRIDWAIKLERAL
jgi:hypothetical protein